MIILDVIFFQLIQPIPAIIREMIDITRIRPPAISKKNFPIELGRIRKMMIRNQIIDEFLFI